MRRVDFGHTDVLHLGVESYRHLEILLSRVSGGVERVGGGRWMVSGEENDESKPGRVNGLKLYWSRYLNGRFALGLMELY